jgi:hypothetical protein
MDVEALARPGMNPGEPVIFEQQTRLQKVAGKTMLGEKSPNMPGHEQTECDPEKDNRGDIYRRESVAPRSREESFSALKHETGISRSNCSSVSSKILSARGRRPAQGLPAQAFGLFGMD